MAELTADCEISHLSMDYVLIEVEPPDDVPDPTGDAVRVAFVTAPQTDPLVADWVTGSWVSKTLVTGEKRFWVRALVGAPNGKVLAAGRYYPKVEITDNPTKPVLDAKGALVVT